ncbi:PREDICTED: uncharacterized protein LOC109340359 [Lupinus angustifolius]|uniref:uncharacterized protein LOC109340359 n=1 Tax=Lupinus angustifolius TaxID=3871 RepID=UPI00092E533E|nr:PREDICTED: uncharacterized protein LOC109340359 [Lupinus angustifolius]
MAYNQNVDIHDEVDNFMKQFQHKLDQSLVKERIPYPTASSKAKEKEKQFQRFKEVFKSLQINIPFFEALEQMPVCSKFMMELLSIKKSYQDIEDIHLNTSCSAILQSNIPKKQEDLGSVTIQVTIGKVNVGKALVDLGASVSLVQISLKRRMGGVQLKPTRMSLQLADRFIKYPEGVCEEVLVKVDRFLIPVDFTVIDISEDVEIPLILGRPFMRIVKMEIYMENGKLKVCVDNEEIQFDIFQVMHHLKNKGQCFQIDVLDGICEQPQLDEPLEMSTDFVEEDQIKELIKTLDANRSSLYKKGRKIARVETRYQHCNWN